MNEKILKNRDKIDNADEQIFDLLLERLDAVTAIGHIKKQEGLPVLDQERENAIYAKKLIFSILSVLFNPNSFFKINIAKIFKIKTRSKKIKETVKVIFKKEVIINFW